MTVEELKQNHPETYNAIFKAGSAAEQDRVGAWMAHANTDLDAVKEGIKSGNDINATQREEFLVKASQLKHIENMIVESPEVVDPAEPKSEAETVAEEADAFYAKVDAKLNPKKS